MSKKGVVWVSTVLYILISLTVLSLVLVSVQPIIDKNRDKTICSQSEQVLRNIDDTMGKVSENQGNRFSSDVKISRGNLIINSSSNRIEWQLKDSAYQYSEENQEITQGKIHIITKKNGNKWQVSMYLDYQDVYDLSFNNQEISRVLTESSQDYSLSFENIDAQNKKIDISLG
jgi:hypothetical protein